MNSFHNKHVVITGSQSGIGACLVQSFRDAGAHVYGIDLKKGGFTQGDLSDPAVIESFAVAVLEDAGSVDILINNAPPLFLGIDDCSYEQFMKSLAIGAGAPYYLARLFAPSMPAGSCILNLSSTRQFMSQAQSESYAAAKGAIGSLTHTLAMSLAPKIRVNAIAPGWIEVSGNAHTKADDMQQPSGRVGKPEDIAALAMFLCSEKAAFINGQTIVCDGGMSRRMIYDGDEGWSYDPSVQHS